MFQILLIRELLIVELPIPQHPYLPSAVGENADETEHAGFGHESEWKGEGIGDADEHPCDTAHEEEDGGGNEVDVGVAGGVESAEVGQQHAGVDDGGEGQPRALLVVDRVDSRCLQFEGEVVVVEEEVVVGSPHLEVDGDHKDHLDRHRHHETQPRHTQGGKFEDLDEADDHAAADDVVDDHVAAAEPPPHAHPRPAAQTHHLHHPQLETAQPHQQTPQEIQSQQKQHLVDADGSPDSPQSETSDGQHNIDGRVGEVSDETAQNEQNVEKHDHPPGNSHPHPSQRPCTGINGHQRNQPTAEADLDEESPLEGTGEVLTVAEDVVGCRHGLACSVDGEDEAVEVVEEVDIGTAVVADQQEAGQPRTVGLESGEDFVMDCCEGYDAARRDVVDLDGVGRVRIVGLVGLPVAEEGGEGAVEGGDRFDEQRLRLRVQYHGDVLPLSLEVDVQTGQTLAAGSRDQQQQQHRLPSHLLSYLYKTLPNQYILTQPTSQQFNTSTIHNQRDGLRSLFTRIITLPVFWPNSNRRRPCGQDYTPFRQSKVECSLLAFMRDCSSRMAAGNCLAQSKYRNP